MRRTGVIVQARMGSSRLPGKILKDFEGKTLLEHIIGRLKRMKSEACIIIATSESKKDDEVELFCKTKQVRCFRGDELNVLKRYYNCAIEYSFDDIVRMTGDNPFPDIEELDKLITFHQENHMDFSENFSVLPIGVGMEIMSFKALEESFYHATLPKHFEHVDEYILDNLAYYRHATVKVSKEKNRPEIRLTVDDIQDYQKACFIIKNAKGEYITTEQAIAIDHAYEEQIVER